MCILQKSPLQSASQGYAATWWLINVHQNKLDWRLWIVSQVLFSILLFAASVTYSQQIDLMWTCACVSSSWNQWSDANHKLQTVGHYLGRMLSESLVAAFSFKRSFPWVRVQLNLMFFLSEAGLSGECVIIINTNLFSVEKSIWNKFFPALPRNASSKINKSNSCRFHIHSAGMLVGVGCLHLSHSLQCLLGSSAHVFNSWPWVAFANWASYMPSKAKFFHYVHLVWTLLITFEWNCS